MSEQTFDLSTLDGNNGFTIETEEGGNLGYSVKSAGDINGDGIEDIVIGAPLANANNKDNSGKTYVVFGTKNGFNSVIKTSELDGTNGFIINGANIGDESGRSVSTVGDFNGDGIDDLAIGAPFSGIDGEQSGAVYVVYGNNNPDYFTTPIELSDLGEKGLTIRGFSAGDNAGWSVSNAGDINGDGKADLLISATDPGGNGAGIKGESYVVFGQDDFSSSVDIADIIDNNKGLKIISNQDNNLGYSVSSAGDVNNDGIDDLIIGAPYADPNNNNNAGQSFIIYGQTEFTSNTINVSELSLEQGLTINGQNSDQSGFFVSPAGDFNGDGISDVIIGARDGNPNNTEFAGRVYIVYGQEGGFDSNIDLANLDASTGLVINGINSEDNAGWSVSSLGDFNGDGKDDIIIGAPNADPDNKNSAGQAYVVYGSDSLGATLNLQDLNGTNGFIINGLVAGANLGHSVASSDINQDGTPDLIVSAPFANNGMGTAYVIFGTPTNQAPTDLALSNNSINENVPAGTEVGDLSTTDPNAGDTFTYTLLSVDNAAVADDETDLFKIVDGKLKVNFSPDFETKPSYTVRVKTTDQGGLSYEKYLTININDVNEDSGNQAPTDLALSNNSINENVAAGTVVGDLSTTDPNAGDTFTYTLLSVDNAAVADDETDLFKIVDGKLKVNFSPDFETKPSYTVRVKTTDQGGLSYEKDLTININDVNEDSGNQAPTDLALSNNSINENVAVGTVVGDLSTTDPNAEDNIFIYELPAGIADNDLFKVENGKLKVKFIPDFETKRNYSIKVKTTDQGGLSYQKDFTININDVNEDSVNPSEFLLNKISDDVFNIQGNNGKATLEVKLTGRKASSVNELGVFTVDDASGKINGIAPGEAGYTQAALQRSQVIFSTIARVPTGFNSTQLSRLLGFNSNDNLRFYLVKGGSTDSVISGSTPQTNVLFPSASSLRITDLGSGNYSLNWEDGTGSNDFADLTVNISGTNQSVPLGTNLQNKSQGESLDLRSLSKNQTVQANFTINREASFNNTVGFYRVVNEQGGIDIDGNGTADINPGQSGYIQAAINSRVEGLNLSAANGTTATYSGSLQGGYIFAPFLIINSTVDAFLDGNSSNNPQIYFSFLGANSDGVDHVRVLGDNTFGFEDLPGGGDKDFNDVIVKVNFPTVV